ncbi:MULTISPECIES: response regulator transcription factor [Methylomonas]|uniref:response regulator transcription factor n=1 Tax=Methylomonas TaxID=416 RepID=UPI001232717E|nr:response regulator [Methylomonas rhizoryzae]
MAELTIKTLSKIFIVDDDPSLRKALALVLEQEGMSVLAFNSAEDFLASSMPKCHSCAIVDMHLPGMSGLELQEVLVKMHIALPVIILTGYGEIPASVKAIKLGAEDYLVKPVTREKLVTAVQSALAKCEQMHTTTERRQQAEQRLRYLTKREREVMLLATRGSSDKEIARHLNISHRTVEKHKSSLMHKTGSTKLLDLITLASECGLIFGDGLES